MKPTGKDEKLYDFKPGGKICGRLRCCSPNSSYTLGCLVWLLWLVNGSTVVQTTSVGNLRARLAPLPLSYLQEVGATGEDSVSPTLCRKLRVRTLYCQAQM